MVSRGPRGFDRTVLAARARAVAASETLGIILSITRRVRYSRDLPGSATFADAGRTSSPRHTASTAPRHGVVRCFLLILALLALGLAVCLPAFAHLSPSELSTARAGREAGRHMACGEDGSTSQLQCSQARGLASQGHRATEQVAASSLV
ncbi:unnamed protein product [Prorocentrum cordatum]|uniref:Uncharacterized protein n=1 Tax=Prorocentrum cordatum TaxID=2364126 RepID=A0ABN9TRH5_9DINO|nr:unnamed protein product [Polarella glacialis]